MAKAKVVPSVSIDAQRGGYIVRGNWVGIKADRTDVCGFCVRTKFDADRLVAAIKAGVVFTNPSIKTNIYGDTYVNSNCQLGRRLNSGLKKLGF